MRKRKKSKRNETTWENCAYASSIGERGWLISIPSTHGLIFDFSFVCISYIYARVEQMWTGKYAKWIKKARVRSLSFSFARTRKPTDLLIESENFTIYYVHIWLCFGTKPIFFSWRHHECIKTGVELTMSNRQPWRQHRKYNHYSSTTTWPECSWSSSGMRKRISKGECRTRYRATWSLKMNSTLLSKWFSTQKCFATVTACAKHFVGMSCSGSAQYSISAQMRCISATLST